MNWFRKLFNRKEVVVVDCAFNCIKDKCPKWVILDQNYVLEDGTKQVKHEGRCCHAWQTILLTELIQTLRK